MYLSITSIAFWIILKNIFRHLFHTNAHNTNANRVAKSSSVYTLKTLTYTLAIFEPPNFCSGGGEVDHSTRT
jgi:hypothetical protein